MPDKSYLTELKINALHALSIRDNLSFREKNVMRFLYGDDNVKDGLVSDNKPFFLTNTFAVEVGYVNETIPESSIASCRLKVRQLEQTTSLVQSVVVDKSNSEVVARYNCEAGWVILIEKLSLTQAPPLANALFNLFVDLSGYEVKDLTDNEILVMETLAGYEVVYKVLTNNFDFYVYVTNGISGNVTGRFSFETMTGRGARFIVDDIRKTQVVNKAEIIRKKDSVVVDTFRAGHGWDGDINDLMI